MVPEDSVSAHGFSQLCESEQMLRSLQRAKPVSANLCVRACMFCVHVCVSSVSLSGLTDLFRMALQSPFESLSLCE